MYTELVIIIAVVIIITIIIITIIITGFDLTTYDLYFTILVEVFTNHILAEKPTKKYPSKKCPLTFFFQVKVLNTFKMLPSTTVLIWGLLLWCNKSNIRYMLSSGRLFSRVKCLKKNIDGSSPP